MSIDPARALTVAALIVSMAGGLPSAAAEEPTHPVVSRVFRTLVWAERRPDRAQAIMALICCSFSSSMFRYLLVDHSLPAM